MLSNLDGVADAFDEWLFFQRAALVKRYCSILEPRIAAALADGQWELAAALAERVCRVDPTSEAAHRAQIVRGRPEHGALLLGATAALLDTVGVQFEPADDAAYRRNMEAVRAPGSDPTASRTGSRQAGRWA